MPLAETMKMGYTERHDRVFISIARAIFEGWNVILKFCWLRQSKDQKNRTLNNRARIVFIPESCWFMTVPLWIVDGHVRWGCRVSHEDWHEELGDNSKNNWLSWAKGNNPYDFHVATGSLFRKYSWSCSRINLKIVWQIVWQSHRRRQTVWSQQWKQWDYWNLMFVQTKGHSWSKRLSCLHGAEHSCTNLRKMLQSWTL